MVLHVVHQLVKDPAFAPQKQVLKRRLLVLAQKGLENLVKVPAEDRK